ncbi:MAG: aminotransferase class I/II-fold pyridoxal phosphate-dependent enzyme, partial [Burkholderiaceae bacterium]
ANILKQFLLYRTYHGSAMGGVVQAASAAAWADEAHVQANRAAYQAKFDAVLPLLTPHMQVSHPDAGFYLWPKIPPAFAGDDARFAQALLAQYNVVVLPGRYIARDVDGHNPGAGRVRMALVAEQAECLEAAQRVAAFCAAAA